MILKYKVIIVTGGSGLIGRAIIKEINLKGGMGINADIGVDSDLENGSIQTDITSERSVEETIKFVSKYFGKIDWSVNNAYPRTKDWGTLFEDLKYEFGR
jgi:NAD(P)-dependent dehydrogenase (short-subunit alcohol dehydrogenase family)